MVRTRSAPPRPGHEADRPARPDAAAWALFAWLLVSAGALIGTAALAQGPW